MFFTSEKELRGFLRALGSTPPMPVAPPKPKLVEVPVPMPIPLPVPIKEKAPVIDRVIFQDTATVVFWKDGTKTVVKTQNDETFDKEKGLAMAFTKKVCGNSRDYYEMFLEHCK